MSSTTVPNPANGSFPSRSCRLSAGCTFEALGLMIASSLLSRVKQSRLYNLKWFGGTTREMWAPSVLMPLEEGRRHAWCHHPGATVVPGAIIVVIGINTWNKSGLPPLGLVARAGGINRRLNTRSQLENYLQLLLLQPPTSIFYLLLLNRGLNTHSENGQTLGLGRLHHSTPRIYSLAPTQPRQTLTTSHLKDSISLTPLLREETRASTSIPFHKVVILSSFVVSSQVLQFL